MKYMYPACFYPEDKGQYTVIFPDLDGIATYGNNIEDAMRMAEDLLCTWVLTSKKDQEILKEPSDIRDVKPEQEDGFVNLVSADLESYMAKNGKAVKKTLTIPYWLNDMAEREGVNFSKVLQTALMERFHLGPR